MVDTVQPRVLASFRNRSALSLLMNMQLLRWSKAKPTGQDTRLERQSYRTRDCCREPSPRFRRRKKNVLDIPSYRTGDVASLRLCFAFLKVNECYGDVTSTILVWILLLYFYLVMDLDIESIALTTLKWPSCRVPESFKRAR